MRFGYPAEPPTLDPLAPGGGSAATRDILRPVMPALFALTPDLRPEPELVESWPSARDVTADPYTVMLRLREAAWSDGRPITAGDVRFSWERLREGPTGYRYRFLSDVEVVDERTFRLRFERPMRRWWSLFSLDDMVLPAHAYSPDWAEQGPSVSGGPFRIASWEEGLRVRLERNDAYWGNVAVLAAIDVTFVPDDETRLQLLEAGELEAAFFEGEINVGRRARARGFEAVEAPLDGRAAVAGAWGPAWYELDLDVGRIGAAVAAAVAQTLDPAHVAEILEDSGQVMDGIPPRFPVRGPSADGEPAIPGPWSGRGAAEARSSATFRLAYQRGSAAGGIARWAHFRLRDRGMRAELVGLDADAFERSLDTSREAVVLRVRRGADAPDAGAYRGAGAEADAAIDAAETAGGSDEPTLGLDREAWAQAQGHLAGLHGAVPLARVRTWIVAREGVAGLHPTGASSGPLWNAPAWQTA